MTVQKNKDEFELKVKDLEDIINMGGSIIGSNIKRLVVSKVIDDTDDERFKEIYKTYFSDTVDSQTHMFNSRVYYFIIDGNLKRDLIKSPRNYLLINDHLDAMVEDINSYSGAAIKQAILTECNKRDSGEYDTDVMYSNPPFENDLRILINGKNKYLPKDNIYYFIKYNSAGKYFLKRDLEKSPKKESTKIN